MRTLKPRIAAFLKTAAPVLRETYVWLCAVMYCVGVFLILHKR